MTIPAEATRPDNGFIDALHVSGPAGEHAGKLMLFGQFVGSWDLEWAGTGANGEPATVTGELHFGWVLGGRAVQDTWIVPGRRQPGEGQPPSAFHGSTIRFYDPAADAWRSTWVEPVNCRVRRFAGLPAAGDILLVSEEEDPQLTLALHRHRAQTRSPGRARLHTTVAAPGSSRSKCAPPGAAAAEQPGAIAQAWRSSRQVRLARLLKSKDIDVAVMTPNVARSVGLLCARSGHDD